MEKRAMAFTLSRSAVEGVGHVVALTWPLPRRRVPGLSKMRLYLKKKSHTKFQKEGGDEFPMYPKMLFHTKFQKERGQHPLHYQFEKLLTKDQRRPEAQRGKQDKRRRGRR